MTRPATANIPVSEVELLEALLESSIDAIYTKDLQGRYLTINPAGARLLGKTMEEIIGKDDHSVLSPGEARTTIERDREILRNGRTVTYEDVQGSGPAMRAWLTTKGVLRAQDGRQLGLFGISRDITERYRMAQALTINEERLRLCLEAVQLATWDWDVANDTLTWSSNVERVMGIPQEAIPTTRTALLELVDPRDRDLLACALSSATRQLRDQQVDVRLEGAEEPSRWLRLKGRMSGKEGKPPHVMGAVMDITRQKQAEHEARLLSDFQERLVGIVAHDIRNPTSAISSLTHILKDGGSGAGDVPMLAERIARSTSRIQRLTDLLIDFNQLRVSDGLPFSPRSMDIHQLAERIADEAQGAYPNRQLQLESRGDGEGQWDPDRLGQVLSNLIDNALKYGPPESPVLVSTVGDGDRVVIRVSNGGPPIPPEILPLIFEPFRRGTQAQQAQRRGLGLGLYIVREIVMSHKGSIEVTSTQEEGTTFRIVLPRQAAPQGA